jgi:hypothetical protein
MQLGVLLCVRGGIHEVLTEKTICDRSPRAVSVAHRPTGPIEPNPEETSHSIAAVGGWVGGWPAGESGGESPRHRIVDLTHVRAHGGARHLHLFAQLVWGGCGTVHGSIT